MLLGPLRRTHNDLWQLTLGEYEDLCRAWMYANYIDTQKIAQLAVWLLNGSGNLKYPVHIEDLIGKWVDGRVMSIKEHREYLKRKVASKKKGDK